MTFKIKVCGITLEKDAVLATRLGVDMLGFILYKKSPRFVTKTAARKIIKLVNPTVARVGVFVNADFEAIISVAEFAGLDWIQLSGDEPESLIKNLQRRKLKVIKAFDPLANDALKKIKGSAADLVMLDNRLSGSFGGSGQTFDWRRAFKSNKFMLSAGLNKDNVAEGIKKFKPLVVDVNSGIERSPGIKSEKKMNEFFKTCNRIRYAS